MCGDNLTGGLSPEWASYEKPFRYMDRFYEALCKDVAAQQKDGYIFPVRMQQEIVAKLPKAFVLTSEFDCYRRDSSKLAERFASVGRLEDFLVLPGLNHVSPLVMFPSDSPMQEAFWDKLSSVVNECL